MSSQGYRRLCRYPNSTGRKRVGNDGQSGDHASLKVNTHTGLMRGVLREMFGNAWKFTGKRMRIVGNPSGRHACLASMLAAVWLFVIAASPALAADLRPLRVAGDQDYPPITYLEDQVARGFDVDVLKALAGVMGRELQLELLPWELAQKRVQEGASDVLTGMSVTEARRKSWDFATPTLVHTFNLFITNKEVAIHGLADLQGKRVGVKAGALPEAMLKSTPGVALVLIPSYKEGFDLLKQGGIDAVAADQWVGGYILNKYRIDGVVIAGQPFATLESGIAVRKGNLALLKEVNEGLEKLKQRGTIEVIRRQWEPKQVVYFLKEEVTSIIVWTASGAALLLFGAMAAWIVTLRRDARVRHKIAAEMRAMFEQAAVGMSVTDLTGHYIRVNQKYADIVGYTPQELVGMNFRQVTHPDDLVTNLELAERRWLGQIENFSMEKRYVRKDGSTTWVNMTIAAIRGSDGKPLHTLGVITDISERKRAEQALAESERRYRTIIDAMAEGVVLRRASDSTLLLSNPAAERMRGGSVRNVIDYAELRQQGWSVIREDGSPFPEEELPFEVTRRTGRPQYNVVRGRKQADGQLTWTLSNSQPLFEPGVATPYAVVITTVDITENKRFEAALERTMRNTAKMTGADFMRTLVVEMALALDARYCFISEILPDNPLRARMLAFCADGAIIENAEYDLAGTPCAEVSTAALRHYPHGLRQLFPNDPALPQLQAESYLGTAVCAADGSVLGLMSVMDDKPMEQGTMGRALLSIFAARAGSELERMRLDLKIRELNQDLEQRVSERTAQLESANHDLEKANAELGESIYRLKLTQADLIRAEKLAALGSLVAGVAHEINTPIGNALMVASTLREKSGYFAAKIQSGTLRRSMLDEYTGTITQGSELLMRNLGQAADLVLSFKQVAVDQSSAQRRGFDLKEMIDEVLSTLHHLVRSKPIRVVTRLAEGVQMDSYPGPLGQVINNLFNNALIHGFAGREGGEITIETRREGEGRVVLEMRDDGNGIAEENLLKVFDPFFTTRLGQGGSGLGLNIVHNIVTQLLGGRIMVDSTLAVGTRFRIELPLSAPMTKDVGKVYTNIHEQPATPLATTAHNPSHS